jgi:hypothetical protein
LTGLRLLAVTAALVPVLMESAYAHIPNGPAFVGAFEKACVPERQSYRGTVANAQSVGWREIDAGTNEELDQVNAIADAALAKDGGSSWTLERTTLGAVIAGNPHFLVVTRLEAPNIITLIGCSLYDFDATETIDPQIVSDFIGSPIEKTYKYATLVAHNWGTSPNLPGTFDTNLTFVGEESPNIEHTGFTGLVLKFDTSEGDVAK